MLRDQELEALEKLLKWLKGFEESELFQDYMRAEGFSEDEYANVWRTLEAAVHRRVAMGFALQGGVKLFQMPPLEGKCSGCNWEASFVYVLAQNESQAHELLKREEAGLCGECMCEMVVQTERLIIHDLVRMEKPAL